MYTALIKNGIYIPDDNSAAISSEYLSNVALGRCFKIQSQNLRQGQVLKKISKLRLCIELDGFCWKKQFNLGLSEDRLPDKKWLLNLLYSFNPENKNLTYYQDCDNVFGLTKDDLTQIIISQKSFEIVGYVFGSAKRYEIFQNDFRKTCFESNKINQEKNNENIIQEQIKGYEWFQKNKLIPRLINSRGLAYEKAFQVVKDEMNTQS
ncbi:unnamed protein product [Paramecium pentaurelia]|uniref:Uncharacterized protein n=1 Tax=Paramecium pentaurelia TaxID=43138 RepID=A0A8S1V488_9CILI|nr:unnamed protein product [Paramecium pentaurelia]